MVRIRLLDTVRLRAGRYPPGAIVDVDPYVAGRLLRHRQGEEVKDAPAPASHSDQAIDLAEALREAIPGLQPKPAAALVAAGFETAADVFAADAGDLRAVDGVADGTITAIETARAGESNA